MAAVGTGGAAALRGTVALGVWLVGSVVLWAMGVGAKETCSSEVGSVEPLEAGALLVPCDLVGWVQVIVLIGGASIFLVGCLSGAWKRWPASIAAGATMVLLPVLGIVALSSVGLR